MTLNYTRHRIPLDLSKQPLKQMKLDFRAQCVLLSFNLATSNNVVFMLAWVKTNAISVPLVGMKCFDCMNLEQHLLV